MKVEDRKKIGNMTKDETKEEKERGGEERKGLEYSVGGENEEGIGGKRRKGVSERKREEE